MNQIARCLMVLLLLVSAPLRAELDVGDMQPMPDMRWLDSAGEKHQLSDYSGKPLVLHFWAAWCIPCRHEMPEMIQWREAHPEYTVLALSLDERLAQTEHFIKKNDFDMPALLLHPEDTLMIPVVPYTIFVTQDHKFAAYSAGVAPWLDAEYSKQVASFLAK